MVKKLCSFCGTDNDVTVLFLDNDTSNNQKNNMLLCCRLCLRQYFVLRCKNSFRMLRDLGYRCDNIGSWSWDGNRIQKELEEPKKLNFQIGKLENEIKVLNKHLNLIQRSNSEYYFNPLKENEQRIYYQMQPRCTVCNKELTFISDLAFCCDLQYTLEPETRVLKGVKI